MRSGDGGGVNAAKESKESFSLSAPAIALPKGGGAIRGIGEKLSANPVTGTAGFSVPIFTSPGRGGFGPRLALAYDSGVGNGPFGFGWSLGLPAITRKTEKGLPRYRDETDVFVLAGAEDLVPELDSDGEPVEVARDGYRVRRYRPRIEGLFARIERWSRSGDVHWRSTSRDNTTTIYGRTEDSRIADPTDPDRIFSWLVSDSHDGNGNGIAYTYAREDDRGVDRSSPHERNRTATAARYLTRIRYGNREMQLATADPAPASWLFEVVLDYGEGFVEPISASSVRASATASRDWPVRPDPFSSYRAGFEVRTYRRCERILMFHRFAELGSEPYLVRSTELTYDDLDYATGPSIEVELAHRGSTRTGSFLRRISQHGHLRDTAQTYSTRSLPPIGLDYSRAAIDETVRELDAESVTNLPSGLDGNQARWVDLDGEGLSGALLAEPGGWFYKRNLGARDNQPRLGPVEQLPTLPAPADLRTQQLVDVSGNGRLDLVQFSGSLAGYFERTATGGWESFRAFTSVPSVAVEARDRRMVDLTGDGLADLLESDGEAFTWYPSLGERGFGAAERVPQAVDEERGPRLVLTDGTQSIYLADMSGDGLVDLVRVRNGEVCFWPNLGYGRFGAKVTLDRSPWLDEPDRFDQRRVRLVDVDGSGTTDLVYLGPDSVAVYFNQSGNGFSSAKRLSPSPQFDDASSVMAADLLGNGTACLVWSSALPRDQARPIRYVDLMGGVKPYLLTTVDNNLGAATHLSYAPSTKFYLADRRAGAPWGTRLPFPVHCVDRVTVTDRWRGTSFATTYSYHHGYYDGVERELRGFGRVERVDVETYGTFAAANVASPYVTPDRTLYQPPVKTITWYDTGAVPEREQLEADREAEYFRPAAGGFHEHRLPGHALPATDDTEEWREALRACKGRVLREEVYELDVDVLDATGEHRPVRLFSTALHTHEVQRLQPRGPNRHAVFLTTERESLAYHYDLDLRPPAPDPDPRVAHTLNLDTDRFGNVRQAIAVAYPRWGTHADADLTPDTVATIARVQGELHVSYTEQRFTNAVDDLTGYRTPLTSEVLTYELTGVTPASGYFTLAELHPLALSDVYETRGPPVLVGTRAYHEQPGTGRERRIVEHARTLYCDASLVAPRALGQIDARGLKFEDYKLALTDALLAAVLGPLVTPAVRTVLATPARTGYLTGPSLVARFGAASSGQYWMRSGVAEHDATRFYLPVAYVDAFDQRTRLAYLHDLLVASTTDAVDNTVTVTAFDLRTLAPARIEDANGNLSEVSHDVLGMPTAIAQLAGGDSVAGLDVSARSGPFFVGTYDETAAAALLGNATARHVYSLGEQIEPDGTITWGHHPACAASIQRERHRADLPAGGRLQVAFEYSDGGGGVLVKKAKAEAAEGTTTRRWIASGKTVVNNKGKPVKQYEPYWSSNEHRFEEVAEIGVSTTLYYDAIGRTIRTESPDGSYSRVEPSPWHVATYDANDTVGEPGNAWYATHTATGSSPESQRAAAAALIHADTPAVSFLDSLGRDVVTVVHERHLDPGTTAPSNERHVTVMKLDAEGKPLWIRDARGNLPMQHIQPPMADDAAVDVTAGFAPCYDLAGNVLFQHGMDTGDSWTLNDAVGKPMFAWTANERAGTREARLVDARYDALHRPTDVWLSTNGGPPELIEQRTYGEGVANDRALNLRGRLHEHRDPSGLSVAVRHDFAGRLVEVSRRLADQYRAPRLDWQTATLEQEPFTQITTYDALGRLQRMHAWHRPNGRVAVHEPTYNDRGLLEREVLILRATKTATGHVEGAGSRRSTVVDGITYDAKGQRTAIRHGNGTRTRFTHDPQTFRLVQLRTTRPNYDPAFPSSVAQFRNANVVQNLFYTYDAIGNVTEIYDDAFRPAFFANQVIEAAARYTYDSLYRLIAATGREQVGLGPPVQFESAASATPFPIAQGNPADQRNYQERYRYDAAGNLLQVAHTSVTGWTRNHAYADHSNRLARTWFGANTLDATSYPHDTHGNILAFASVAPADRLEWDHRDMIRVLERGGGGRVYYQYDADKQRTRKVSETQNGAQGWERIYLGGLEIYRRYAGGVVVEETETHHVMEGDRRVLLVEDVLATNRPGAVTGFLDRYQYANHLGSRCLELDGAAAVITYEEFHPYGTSAYRMARSQTEAPKRYRFTGMERDDESGLGYHKVRYYAPWLGRWASCDPAGMVDGVSLYPYCRNNPSSRTDVGGKQSAPAAVRDPEKRSEPPTSTRDYLANAAGAAPPLLEGIIWNTWLTGTPRGMSTDLVRGAIIDRLTGNNLGQYEPLADRRVGNVIEQVKSFWRTTANAATQVQRVAVAATRDAAEYVRRLPRAERLTRILPRAQIVLPSWASASLERAAETALQAVGRARLAYRALPTFALAPLVTRGIPGLVGIAARTLQRVAAPLLAVGLVRGIIRDDKLAIADNSIGLVPIALQAASRLASATPRAATTLARFSHVAAAFSVGWAVGRTIDEHALSDETRNTIGGTMNEIITNDGWKEITKNPFGLKTLYQSLTN